MVFYIKRTILFLEIILRNLNLKDFSYKTRRFEGDIIAIKLFMELFIHWCLCDITILKKIWRKSNIFKYSDCVNIFPSLSYKHPVLPTHHPSDGCVLNLLVWFHEPDVRVLKSADKSTSVRCRPPVVLTICQNVPQAFW